MASFYQWFELLSQVSFSRNRLREENLWLSDLLRRYFQEKLAREWEAGKGRGQAKQGWSFRQCLSWPQLEPKGELWSIRYTSECLILGKKLGLSSLVSARHSLRSVVRVGEDMKARGIHSQNFLLLYLGKAMLPVA